MNKIIDSQGICHAIEKHQQIANLKNSRVNSKNKTSTSSLTIHQTKAFVIEKPTGPTETKVRTIDKMKLYYNFFNDLNDKDNDLKSFVFSDGNQPLNIKYIDTTVSNNEEVNNEIIVDRVQEDMISFNSLSKKVISLKILEREKSNFINSSQLDSLNLTSEDSDTDSSEYDFCKEKCINCQHICKYRLSEIHFSNKSLPMCDIVEELGNHQHQKSRKNKITQINRSLVEAKKELFNHYKNYHFQ